MGFDAFALNLAAPTASWAIDAVNQLFAHAGEVGFKLFFSMDTAGGSWQFSDWSNLLQGYLGHEAYYRGPNGFPFLSTFDGGPWSPADWANFKASYANQLYFVPDFDSTQGYYTDIDAWMYAWYNVIDGAFSWETAWWELSPASHPRVLIAFDRPTGQACQHGRTSECINRIRPIRHDWYKCQ